MPRVPKITSLQCLCQISRNKGGMNLIFLHAEKHQFFLQVKTINFSGHGYLCPKYPK